MLDLTRLGRKILEARKAQGLTQEQLGTELGVSPQAVSRWENGESAPDIALLPDICRVLGISADTLLGIDGAIGIQTLARELARRLSEQKEQRHKALVGVLGQIFHGWTWFILEDPHINVVVFRRPEEVKGIALWRDDGLALFADGEALAADGVPPELMAQLRALVAPVHWEIAMALLKRPAAKEKDLLDIGVCDSEDALRTALDEMMESALIYRDHAGYHLTEKSALIWAGVLKSLLKVDLRNVGTGFAHAFVTGCNRVVGSVTPRSTPRSALR